MTYKDAMAAARLIENEQLPWFNGRTDRRWPERIKENAHVRPVGAVRKMTDKNGKPYYDLYVAFHNQLTGKQTLFRKYDY